MPALRVHMHACDRVAPQLNIEGDRLDIFKFGGVFPDMALYKFFGDNVDYWKWEMHRYYQTIGMVANIPDHEGFVDKLYVKYGEDWKKNEFLLGYLLHLILDAEFNTELNHRSEIIDKTKYAIRTSYNTYVVKDNLDAFLRMKFQDMDVFARTLEYEPIKLKDMPDEINPYIEFVSAQKLSTVPNMLIILKDNVDKLMVGSLTMFTEEEYKQMIDIAITEFLKVVKLPVSKGA